MLGQKTSMYRCQDTKVSTKCNITITYGPNTHTYPLRKGLRLDALNARHKTALEFDCRKADCGICLFSVTKGMNNLSEKTFSEKDYLKALDAEPNERLACQCRATGDVALEIDKYE